uniref:Cell cycle associated protein 1a n=1 Tax=Oncorhynchus kisutch TaxID=8019 RepID=A0A8C7CKZ1_ONCKI
MPSATVGNNAVQSSSPELGSGTQSEAMKQVLQVIDKKVRNMEKKKIQKAVKKSARREQLQREETEQRRLKTVLELQFLLDRLGDEQTRQDLKQPAAGSPLLTDADLTALDNFYKLVGPERDHDVRLTDQYDEASLHLWELLEGRDQAVAGTTLDINQCIPFTERTVTQEYTEAIEVEATEFVNRQFIPETTYSSTGNDQVERWTAEVQVVNVLQHQSPPQMTPEPHTVNPVSHTPDPVVRKQVVQDLMAQMQGTYNFMQDSMLEFDGHALDPAIVLAQPMKSAQSVVLQHMVHSESRLSQSSSVPESTHVPMVSSTPDCYSSTAPLYQPSHTAEPRPQTDCTDHIQASMSLSSEQSPAPSSLPSAFLPVSTPHSGGINVNAAPFQSMQAVFNLNAPVPPTNEADSLKQNQFPSGYGQGFSSQAEHSVEEPDIQHDTLQSAVGGFHTQDQVMSAAAGHQVQSSQGPGFGRQGQSFYNSRGAVSRGGPRNPRGMINGYRGSSNGFRGGYDGYRPPFSNTPNNGYGQQAQFSTASRDYPNSTYQREGYQPGYKRGAVQGPRGCSRGNAQAMRS